MKKMYRIMLLLVCAAVAFLAVSCGKGDGASSGSNVKVEDKNFGGRKVTWISQNGVGAKEDSPTYQQEMAFLKEMETKYNCTLEFQAAGDYHAFVSTLTSMAMSGQKYADLIWAPTENTFPKFMLNDLFAPVDDYFDFTEDFWNAEYNDAFIVNGKHYGITNWKNPAGWVIYFNKRLCAENGITDTQLYELQAKGEWTWAKLEEFARQCTKTAKGEWGFASAGGCWAYPWPFIYANGTTPVIREGNNFKYNLNTPAAIEAIEFMHKLVEESKVVPTEKSEYGYSDGLFKSGKIAFLNDETYNMSLIAEALKNDKFGVLLIPKGPKAEDYVNSSGAPSFVVMQPMTEDKDILAKLASDYIRPKDWQEVKSQADMYKPYYCDDQSYETLKMMETRSKTRYESACTWFKQNVLWTNWGINDKIPARTFVEQNQAASQSALDEMWSKDMEVSE